MGPRFRLPPHEQAKGKFLANLQQAVAVPKSTSYRATLSFSLFYTAAVTLPFVVTVAYWLWVFPYSDFAPDSLYWPRDLQYFNIANGSIVNSMVAFCEIMALSSVRKQDVSSRPICESYSQSCSQLRLMS